MLADFCLLDLLTKTGTVSGTIFANNPDLFGALRLQEDIEALYCDVQLDCGYIWSCD